MNKITRMNKELKRETYALRLKGTSIYGWVDNEFLGRQTFTICFNGVNYGHVSENVGKFQFASFNLQDNKWHGNYKTIKDAAEALLNKLLKSKLYDLDAARVSIILRDMA
jgi:hypothetical protein